VCVCVGVGIFVRARVSVSLAVWLLGLSFVCTIIIITSRSSGCSVQAAHESPASYTDGNSFSLFSPKTMAGWVFRAIFHGIFVACIALNVFAPATFIGSSGSGGGSAARTDTAVATFILYRTPHTHTPNFTTPNPLTFPQLLRHAVHCAAQRLLHLPHASSLHRHRRLHHRRVRALSCSWRPPVLGFTHVRAPRLLSTIPSFVQTFVQCRNRTQHHALQPASLTRAPAATTSLPLSFCRSRGSGLHACLLLLQ